MNRTLDFHADPGHGWLEVSRADLAALGLTGHISGCSYERGDRVYLEEDVDAPAFLRAARAAGWVVTTRERYTPGASFVRELEVYGADG